MRSFEWYTNGKVNIKLYDGAVLENGTSFYKGFTPKKKYTKHNKKAEHAKRNVAKSLRTGSLQNRVDEMCKTKSYDEIVEQLRTGNSIVDSYLEDLVLERCLIFQLSKMPKFFETIVGQLRDLYARNPALQSRTSVKEYMSQAAAIEV